MGGEGSGRKPDVMKMVNAQRATIASIRGENLEIPNYSGLKKEVRKTEDYYFENLGISNLSGSNIIANTISGSCIIAISNRVIQEPFIADKAAYTESIIVDPINAGYAAYQMLPVDNHQLYYGDNNHRSYAVRYFLHHTFRLDFHDVGVGTGLIFNLNGSDLWNINTPDINTLRIGSAGGEAAFFWKAHYAPATNLSGANIFKIPSGTTGTTIVAECVASQSGNALSVHTPANIETFWVTPSGNTKLSGGNLFMQNTAEPTITYTGAEGALFISGGALYFKGGAGSVTKVANA